MYGAVMTNRSKRVTIRTVAEDAQVSVAAVSKVLRNSYGVSDEMRRKVHASMEKLRYRPHTAARGMRGKTFTIGVLQNDLRNPFLPSIYDGISEGLEGSGYQALLGVGQSNEPLETALIESMINRQMDGLIMVSPRLPQAELDRFAQQVPTCVVAYHQSSPTHFDTVNFDDQAGARMAVGHLAEQGCCNVWMLSLKLPEGDVTNVIRQRELGFQAALGKGSEAGKHNIVYSDFQEGVTRAAIADLLRQPDAPDGLFCWSDMIVKDVFIVARELGVRIPEDLAVVGYDNTFDDELRPVSVSSLDQTGKTLGNEAARLLLERIEGRTDAQQTIFPPDLVIRTSSKKP